MKNAFFRLALAQATKLLGKPGRLAQLVARMLHRLYHSDRKELSVKAVREKFQVLGRLIVAYARGRYRAIPVKALIAVVAAVVYFLNPIDFIPDALLGIGLTDDFAVLAWVYHSAQKEIEAFLRWENNTLLSESESKG